MNPSRELPDSSQVTGNPETEIYRRQAATM
jgi:hypothetical protein